MARPRTHKDLEFFVEGGNGEEPPGSPFSRFDEAAGMAVAISASNGLPSKLDVVVYSLAGARVYAGDHGVEVFTEDPDSSIHDRIIITAESQGRVV